LEFIFPLDFLPLLPMHPSGPLGDRIFGWLLEEFCGKFSARFAMSPFLHGKESPIRDPVHSDIPELQGAELASVYYGRRMAGDFYDCVRVSPNRVLFGLLDAAGGLRETRAIVAATQDTFRTAGTKLFVRRDINAADAMMELCMQLNQTVLQAADGVCSCPAFVGCYDESLGIVCYCNAGHTPGLLRDHAGVSELPATGLPLGLFSHMISDAPMAALEAGGVLLLASRGIVEAKGKAEEFGLQRVKEVLQQSKAASAKALCVSLLDQVQQFMHAAPTHNDVTVLALARNS
jgi:serine phosphatase RsbU (regulator of sigma subunit)